MEEFSNLTTVLHQELNYDFYWAVNETSRILSKAIGEEYGDIEECDNSMEGLYKKSHVYQL